ncbi:MAG: hypothetical protein DRP47_05960 [Candidatus Zixiibacteriota bacterium]|nr:MAG: hypothetical protein DRP47_05960 [candidate division Zixibacteria bacterium]
MRYFLLPLFLLSIILTITPVKADDRSQIINQKSELESIQKEVKRSREHLDSLKIEEIATQKQISDIDQRITTNQKVIKRLNKQLSKVREGISDVEKELENNQDRLDLTRRRYLGDIRQFYSRAVHLSQVSLWETPLAEVERSRQSRYLAALASFETANIDMAATSVAQTSDRLDQLTDEKKQVASLKKNKEVATALEESRKHKEEKSLESLHRAKMVEGDRMLTLQQASKEIERVIARLENERRQRTNRNLPIGPSVFATLKGQLVCPYRGKIVVPFGFTIDPVTRLESFSPGITIEGRPSGPVVAVAGGSVAYVGNLRGYGNFVIINHDGQYYTTYGGLGKIAISQGEYLPTETVLAAANKDGLVKFELRFGREPLDPVKWIKIDAF